MVCGRSLQLYLGKTFDIIVTENFKKVFDTEK